MQNFYWVFFSCLLFSFSSFSWQIYYHFHPLLVLVVKASLPICESIGCDRFDFITFIWWFKVFHITLIFLYSMRFDYYWFRNDVKRNSLQKILISLYFCFAKAREYYAINLSYQKILSSHQWILDLVGSPNLRVGFFWNILSVYFQLMFMPSLVSPAFLVLSNIVFYLWKQHFILHLMIVWFCFRLFIELKATFCFWGRWLPSIILKCCPCL